MEKQIEDYTEADLSDFKLSLLNHTVKCPVCNAKYKIHTNTIDNAVLTKELNKTVTKLPFYINTFDLYACTVAGCNGAFGFPSDEFVEAYFLEKSITRNVTHKLDIGELKINSENDLISAIIEKAKALPKNPTIGDTSTLKYASVKEPRNILLTIYFECVGLENWTYLINDKSTVLLNSENYKIV